MYIVSIHRNDDSDSDSDPASDSDSDRDIDSASDSDRNSDIDRDSDTAQGIDSAPDTDTARNTDTAQKAAVALPPRASSVQPSLSRVTGSQSHESVKVVVVVPGARMNRMIIIYLRPSVHAALERATKNKSVYIRQAIENALRDPKIIERAFERRWENDRGYTETPNKQVSVRCDTHSIGKLNRLAEMTGLSKNEVMRLVIEGRLATQGA